MTDLLQPYDYLVRNAKEIPGDIAITDGDTTLTWHELFELTKRIARELRDRGVEPGDTVGTFLPPILTCFVTWAIFHEAAAVLPYFEGFEEPAHLPLRLLVANAPVAGMDPDRLLIIDDAWFEKIHRNSIIIEQRTYPSPESINRYAISSGTTGRPKLLPFSWTNSALRALDSEVRTESATMPMTMFSIRSEIGWQNFFGAAVYQHPYLVARNETTTVDLMRTYKVDILRASPFQLASLITSVEERGLDLPDLRLILPVGGQLPEKLGERLWRVTGAEVGNAYGASEVGRVAMRRTRSQDMSEVGTISPWADVQIVDPETHELLPDGDNGLVRARTHHMISGYANSPEDDVKNFRDGWFYPGDLGRIVDGTLFLVGRTSDIINSGGSRVDPVLVEEAFSGAEGIDQCAVFALPDADGIDRVSLAYVSKDRVDIDVLRRAVEPTLGNLAPVNYFRVDSIPLGETGKVLRRELIAQVTSAMESRPATALPQVTATPIALPADRGNGPEVELRDIPWPLRDEDILQPYDYLVRNAKERPDAVAMTDGDHAFTWRELFDLTKKVAADLRERGVQPGDRVGVLLPPMLSVVVMWGVFHEAAVFSSFSPQMARDNSLDFTLIVTSEPVAEWPIDKTLVADGRWFDRISNNSIVLDQQRYAHNQSICRFVLTSGSSGTPKALAMSISASAVRSMESFVRTSASIKTMSLMPPRSQGWQIFFYNAMMGTTYLVPGDSAHNIALMRRFNVDVIRASPAQLAAMVDELRRSESRLDQLTLILAGGGQLPEALNSELQRLTNAQIGNVYGASEVGGATLRRVDSDDPRRVGPIFDDVDLEIVDPESHLELPAGEIGLVRIRSNEMSTEYHNDPVATAEHFRDGWFYPGDLGRIHHGELFIHGRMSDLINVGGSKIDPLAVEEAFRGFDGITDCAAFGLPDEHGVIRVALAYVSGNEIDDHHARETFSRSLGSGTPTTYVRVTAIPRGDTGKVQRHELVDFYSSSLGEQHTTRHPVRTEKPASAKFVQPFDYVRQGWKKSPNSAALIDSAGTVTRKDVCFRAKRMAKFLRDSGVKPGDIVMVKLPLSLQLSFTLALLHEAAVVAEYGPGIFPANTIGVTWVVSDQLVIGVPESQHILVTEAGLKAIARNTVTIQAQEYPSGDSLMRIAFSSGTTGVPKAIPFTVEQCRERSLDHESRTLSESQFMSLMLPLRGMGWWSWYASIINRRPYIIPGSPRENLDLLQRKKVDAVVASPLQILAVIDEMRSAGTTLPHLRTVQVGGSQLTRAVVAQITSATDAQVVNIYGSTEVGPTTMRRDGDDDPSYVGDVLPDVDVQIVDPETRVPVPDGQIGLVRTRSSTMALEYLGDPVATAESWRDGWFYAGDLGLLKGSKLFLAGRESEIINIGGLKVDPARIDTHFDSEPDFVEHAAFAIPMANGLECIGLAYVPTDTLDLAAVIDRANDTLGKFAPAIFVPVKKIPRNHLDKPQRKALGAWYAKSSSRLG